MSKEHTTQEDFEHFLAYTGYNALHAVEIARLKRAYYHGADSPEEV